MQDQWHYRVEKDGSRAGPVDRAALAQLIADDQFHRSTLVWNPSMPDWAKASATELSDLFQNDPPPLPAHALSRWAIYALALFPLCGAIIQALISVNLADALQIDQRDLFEHWGWIVAFVLINGFLGDLVERNLRRAGIKIRGAAVLSALIVPVYIFVSCRAVRRTTGMSHWRSYLPFELWFLAVVAGLVVSFFLFGEIA